MNIGIIGLGNMGSGMADNIMKSGHSLTVYARRREVAEEFISRGAKWADDPKSLAEVSDIVCTCVSGPKDVESLALGKDGIVEGIKPGAVYIDFSTIPPQMARKIYKAFKVKDAHVMDAPISGGPPLAWAGKLAIMVGGDEDVYKKCNPFLNIIGDRVGYAGEIGSGCICKNIQVAMLYTFQLLIAECMALGVKAGVKPVALWRAFKDSVVGTGELWRQTLPDTIFQNRFDPASMPLRLAIKDMDQAIGLGRDHQVPLPMINLTLQDLLNAYNKGWSEKDVRISMLLEAERAGGVDISISLEEMEQEGYVGVDKW